MFKNIVLDILDSTETSELALHKRISSAKTTGVYAPNMGVDRMIVV